MSPPGELRTVTLTPARSSRACRACDLAGRRARELPARLVVGDQVEVVERAAQTLRQRRRLRGGVVDAAQDDVLEHQLAPRGLHVALARGEHRVERILPVERHETVAQLVGRRVQAHRQVELQRLRGEPVDARHHADRGHGDASRREREPLGVVEQAAGAQGLVVVVERLAHAHEDDVGHAAVVRLVAEHAGEVEDLVDDLLRGEVPAQPQAAGRAERAAHGAADLGGDTDGGAAGHQHQDGLDRVAVGGLEQRLARRSASRGARLHLRQRERREPLGQLLPQLAAGGS